MRKQAPKLPSTIRRIFRCELKKQGHRLLLTVEGSGFLHHMVRNMAGTLLRGRQRIDKLDRFPGTLFQTRPQACGIHRTRSRIDPAKSKILSTWRILISYPAGGCRYGVGRLRHAWSH